MHNTPPHCFFLNVFNKNLSQIYDNDLFFFAYLYTSLTVSSHCLILTTPLGPRVYIYINNTALVNTLILRCVIGIAIPFKYYIRYKLLRITPTIIQCILYPLKTWVYSKILDFIELLYLL